MLTVVCFVSGWVRGEGLLWREACACEEEGRWRKGRQSVFSAGPERTEIEPRPAPGRVSMARPCLLLHLCSVLISLTAVDAKSGDVDANYYNLGSPFHRSDYDYRYSVNDVASGVVNDRWEQRLGEYVKGYYALLGPDGRVRWVDYEVDGDKGFHAVVRTKSPGSWLSVEQLKESKHKHADPPVNVLTDQTIEDPSSVLPPPRSAVGRRGNAHRVRGLPPNYHSTNPYYYLSLNKGQRREYPQRLVVEDPDVSRTREALSTRIEDPNAPSIHLLPPENK